MVTSGTILFVEGGGKDNTKLSRKCSEGFHKFLDKAGFQGKQPTIFASGGRTQAFKDFRNAIKMGKNAILLVDSEDKVKEKSPWKHLQQREGTQFIIPEDATDDQCNLMVVMMESWFLADKKVLVDFYGQGFNQNALPKRTDIENISKKDVYDALFNATAHCKTKKPYSEKNKKDSFTILSKIDPEKVREASTWADRFLNNLEQAMNRQ